MIAVLINVVVVQKPSPHGTADQHPKVTL